LDYAACVSYLLFFLSLTGVALAWNNLASRHAPLRVSVRRHPQPESAVFDIQVQALVQATPQQTWAVLTDYTRLPEFVPDLLSSRLLSRSASEIVIEQRGRAGFLFMRQAIEVVVSVTEQPFSSIDVTLLSGNMKHYNSHWSLTALAPHGGTRLDYHGTLAPDFYVPALLGHALVQRNVKTMLAAVVAEVERRARLSP
jgi:ribosome-associated toxin RatA of RatAB toxin-antitoxin module